MVQFIESGALLWGDQTQPGGGREGRKEGRKGSILVIGIVAEHHQNFSIKDQPPPPPHIEWPISSSCSNVSKAASNKRPLVYCMYPLSLSKPSRLFYLLLKFRGVHDKVDSWYRVV